MLCFGLFVRVLCLLPTTVRTHIFNGFSPPPSLSPSISLPFSPPHSPLSHPSLPPLPPLSPPLPLFSLSLSSFFKYMYEYILSLGIKTLKEVDLAFIPYESRVFSLDIPDALGDFHGSGRHLEAMANHLVTVCSLLEEYPSVRYLR